VQILPDENVKITTFYYALYDVLKQRLISIQE